MKYFIIAGEASGDLHGSNLMKALKQEDAQADFCFLGGDLMQAQGGIMIKHYRDMAFMGFVNVAMNADKVLRNLKECTRALEHYSPDVVILIDYPGFNLKIAKFAKQKLKLPVFYYISPKLWAWKSYRIKSIKRYVDRMFTIFPFETDYFMRLGYRVDYVGNPTVDSVAKFKLETEHKLSIVTEKPIVALLAGSRKQEIKGCLPIISSMAEFFPEYQFVIAGAPGIDPEFYQSLMPTSVQICFDSTYTLLANASAAVVNSGTATLETALIGTPQVVVYHVFGGRIASLLQKILIKIPYVSLVNLISERQVVTELVTHHFTKENLHQELRKLLLDDDYRLQMGSGYAEIAQKLGPPGTAHRTAHAILSSLNKKEV